MGLYSGGLIIGTIFASEILGGLFSGGLIIIIIIFLGGGGRSYRNFTVHIVHDSWWSNGRLFQLSSTVMNYHAQFVKLVAGVKLVDAVLHCPSDRSQTCRVYPPVLRYSYRQSKFPETIPLQKLTNISLTNLCFEFLFVSFQLPLLHKIVLVKGLQRWKS